MTCDKLSFLLSPATVGLSTMAARPLNDEEVLSQLNKMVMFRWSDVPASQF